MKVIILLLVSASCFVLTLAVANNSSLDASLEEEILQRCKYVDCENVVDLNLESRIRRCIKTTCNSAIMKQASLFEDCKSDCIDEVKKQPDNKSKQPGQPSAILDYAWLD